MSSIIDKITLDQWAIENARLKAKKKTRNLLFGIAHHSVLISLSIVFIFPAFLVFVASLETFHQASHHGLWPNPFDFHNYIQVFQEFPFLRWTLNTFLIAILAMIGVVISSVPPAYVLSRLQWKGRQAVFVVVLASFMLPNQVTWIPIYIMFAKLHWINTFYPLIVPAFFSDAFSIFLLRQFFATIPNELSDAAKVDGCNEWKECGK